MEELKVVNQRRRQRRKWLLIGVIPLVLATLLFGAKVITMSIFSNNAVDSFTTGDFTAAQQNADDQKIANVFEPWKAYYNNGTSLIALGEYSDGINELTLALNMSSHPTKECDIRANLAAGYEEYGEKLATENKATLSQTELTASQKVITGTDATCKDKSKNPQSSSSLQQTENQIKKVQADNEDKKSALPQPTKAQLQQIQKQIDQSNAARQKASTVSPPTPDNTSGSAGVGSGTTTPPPVDKPW